MGYDILKGTIINIDNFKLYKSGDESGLNHFYNNMRGPLYYYGLKILNDDFMINTFVQEAFLKAWYLRERMTDALHLFRFLRLCIRWDCSAFFSSKVSRFHKSVTYIDYAENTLQHSCEMDNENDSLVEIRQKSEQINLILNAIKYLPTDKQTIMRLHFDYGLSEKQIAQKYNAPHQTISAQIHKSTDKLKDFLMKAQTKSQHPKNTIKDKYETHLTAPQAEVYRMRVYLRYSVDRIAIELNTTAEKVVNTYIDACNLLKNVKQNANKRNNSYSKDTITYK